MMSIIKEHSYNEVIAGIESKNKVSNSFKQKVGRDDRGNLNPSQNTKANKAWINDGTMYMSEYVIK